MVRYPTLFTLKKALEKEHWEIDVIFLYQKGIREMEGLPRDILRKIRTWFYRIQSAKNNELNKEFLSYIQRPSDMGSIIIYRMHGMLGSLDDIVDLYLPAILVGQNYWVFGRRSGVYLLPRRRVRR